MFFPQGKIFSLFSPNFYSGLNCFGFVLLFSSFGGLSSITNDIQLGSVKITRQNNVSLNKYSLAVSNVPLLIENGDSLAKLELTNEPKFDLQELQNELFALISFKSLLIISQLLILFSFSFVFFREKRKQKNILLELNQINSELKAIGEENDKIQIELIQKEKKLFTGLILILKREKQLEDMREKFLELKKQIKNPNQKIVSEILDDFYLIRNEGAISKAKETLLYLNKGFLKKLLLDFPALSKNEQYLCIYFRLGFNLSEIAAIQGVQIESIRVLKSRLCKKLNISMEGISLFDFLNRYDGA